MTRLTYGQELFQTFSLFIVGIILGWALFGADDLEQTSDAYVEGRLSAIQEHRGQLQQLLDTCATPCACEDYGVTVLERCDSSPTGWTEKGHCENQAPLFIDVIG